MIRFINIDNGRVYNGDAPYVHWFDDQQSIDLVYVKRLCVLSDTEDIHVVMPENDVFRLLDVSKMTDRNTVVMNQVRYQDILNMYCNELVDRGVAYNEYYVHMIYVVGSSDTAVEARETFTINDQPFIVGADFYEEREELKIGVGNFGAEIPESIQRAIYPSNVHEESKDNILMNRKYKELLMDYIDILGNKGSYASLLNSLHWFEYGDLLTIKEFWKHKEWDRIIYNDQEFTQVLAEKSKHLLTNFVKTTYVGIYLAMSVEARNKNADSDGDVVYEKETYTESGKYDTLYSAQLDPALPKSLVSTQGSKVDTLTQIGIGETFVESHPGEYGEPEYEGANWTRQSDWLAEYNRFIAEPVPAMMSAAYIWGRTDLSIKLALLGNFYETYFIPVHLDLIHATIEDIVYTNAIKVLPDGYMDRVDYFEALHNVLCNVKNGQTFLLGDVTVQANNDTTLHTTWKDCWNEDTQEYDYDIHDIIGVDQVVSDVRDDDELRTFAVNFYQGVGVVIPMEFIIPVTKATPIEEDDRDPDCKISRDIIHKTVLSIENDNTGKWDTVMFGKVFGATEEDPTHIHVKFNLLCTKDKTYDLRIQFLCTNGQTYGKKINFTTVDTRRVGLTVYRLKALPSPTSNIKNLHPAGDHMFAHTREIIKSAEVDPRFYYVQYLPAFVNSHGARLNRIIVIRGYISERDPRNPRMMVNRDVFDAMSPGTRNWFEKYFFKYDRHSVWFLGGRIVEDTSLKKYYILVSKSYEFDDPNLENRLLDIKRLNLKEKMIFRNEMGFIPQFHYLEPIHTDKLEDYNIARDETVCVIPDIKYLKNISSYEWIFRNASTLEEFDFNSIKEPIIAYPEKRRAIPAGYYDVIFRYRLSDRQIGAVHEVSLNSAFIQTDLLQDAKYMVFHPETPRNNDPGVIGSSGSGGSGTL